MSKGLLHWSAGFLPVPLHAIFDLSPGFENTHIDLEASEGNLFSPVFEHAKIKHWQFLVFWGVFLFFFFFFSFLLDQQPTKKIFFNLVPSIFFPNCLYPKYSTAPRNEGLQR